MYLSLHARNSYSKVAARHTGKVPFVRKIISRNGHNDQHPCAHWVASMKKYWQYQISSLYSLFIDYLDSDTDDGSDQLLEPCLDANRTIILSGDDDKSTVDVGVDAALEATTRQSWADICVIT